MDDRRLKGHFCLSIGNPEPLESKVTPAAQIFGDCIRKDGSLEKAVLLGLTARRRRRGRPRQRWIDAVISDSQLTLVNAIVLCRDRAGWRHHIQTVRRGRRRRSLVYFVSLAKKAEGGCSFAPPSPQRSCGAPISLHISVVMYVLQYFLQCLAKLFL